LSDTSDKATTGLSSAIGRFRCEICKIDFSSKIVLDGHKMGKQKCSICNEIFENGKKLGHHKIQSHGYTPKQLGWSLNAGWNRMTQLEAFNVTGKAPHGNANFMNSLNTPEYIRIKMLSRKYH
jgi:hypothetical protein